MYSNISNQFCSSHDGVPIKLKKEKWLIRQSKIYHRLTRLFGVQLLEYCWSSCSEAAFTIWSVEATIAICRSHFYYLQQPLLLSAEAAVDICWNCCCSILQLQALSAICWRCCCYLQKLLLVSAETAVALFCSCRLYLLSAEVAVSICWSC